jgi:hypothetical protein
MKPVSPVKEFELSFVAANGILDQDGLKSHSIHRFFKGGVPVTPGRDEREKDTPDRNSL